MIPTWLWLRTGSLFSGYGGLDLAVDEFFDAETVWVSDVDPGANLILAHRTSAPNLGDITKIDWAAVEPVDILTAGWPCQPFSLAGKRKGAADERALWPYVAGAVRALRPRHIVLENVAAIATAGELARALADLAALGYVGSWRRLRAADVGAPHGRARIFIFATDTDSNAVRQQPIRELRRSHPTIARHARPATPADPASDGRHQRRTEPAGIVGRPDVALSGHAPADADGDGQQGVGGLKSVRRHADGCRGSNGTRQQAELATLADAEGDAQGISDGERVPAGQWGPYAPAIARWERVLGRTAPNPTEPGRTGSHRLSPRFVEWMMGLPAGWVTDVPGLSRNAQLKALGNGVVPQQAFRALELMWPLASECAA